MYAVKPEDIRPAAVADAFYPGDASALNLLLDDLFATAKTPNINAEIKGLVAPHAGYRYSGKVAAAGYRQVRLASKAVVAIIAPSHYDRFHGVSVFNGKGYETPLGFVPVASEQANALIEENEAIMSSWLGHRNEHALEVQLPFLQKRFTDFSILPIVMGEQSVDICKMLADAVVDVLKECSSLIIASSDLSHFHEDKIARQIDTATIRLVESFDEDRFTGSLEEFTGQFCGGGPIFTAMLASKQFGAHNAKSVLYRNSGDETGDLSSVVGYLSAVFY